MVKASTLEKIFPPPRYMALHSVGVDISDTSLKYVAFERVHAHDKNLTLTQWGDVPIPGGVVERGNVHDHGVLVSTLKEVRRKAGTAYVTVSLPEERAYLFETTLPRSISRKDMREHIEFRLEENVPLSPRDAYFDFSIIDLDEVTGEYRLVVAVYAQDTINNYYEACIEAGLLPIAFEIEAQAIARATVPWDNDDTHMIVDFGKTRTGIGIVFHGNLAYTSTIDVSG